MDKIKELIIANLTRIMAERELSQVELADLANMDPVQLNRILKGKKGAGRKSLAAIAKALKVPVDELIQSRKPEQKPTPTVGNLLQALTLMEKESVALSDKLNSWLTSPLYQIWKDADENLRVELEHLVQAYARSKSGKDKLGAFQILSPDGPAPFVVAADGKSLQLTAKQSHPPKGR